MGQRTATTPETLLLLHAPVFNLNEIMAGGGVTELFVAELYTFLF